MINQALPYTITIDISAPNTNQESSYLFSLSLFEDNWGGTCSGP